MAVTTRSPTPEKVKVTGTVEPAFGEPLTPVSCTAVAPLNEASAPEAIGVEATVAFEANEDGTDTAVRVSSPVLPLVMITSSSAVVGSEADTLIVGETTARRPLEAEDEFDAAVVVDELDEVPLLQDASEPTDSTARAATAKVATEVERFMGGGPFGETHEVGRGEVREELRGAYRRATHRERDAR